MARGRRYHHLHLKNFELTNPHPFLLLITHNRELPCSDDLKLPPFSLIHSTNPAHHESPSSSQTKQLPSSSSNNLFHNSTHPLQLPLFPLFKYTVNKNYSLTAKPNSGDMKTPSKATHTRFLP